jgi:hypothetical protein
VREKREFRFKKKNSDLKFPNVMNEFTNFFQLFGKDKQPLEVISEIERWLRNPDIGKQCETILFTPQVIELFPFPIVVNTIVSKLASLFNTRYSL